MTAGDFTTLPDVKAWLKQTTSDDDEMLSRLITACSQFMQRVISRDLLSQSYSEVYNGVGMNRMAMPNYPVTAIASVTVDGQTIPASTGPTVNGYVTDGELLYLRGYSFTRGFQNVAVSYTAGFASIPEDLAQACIEVVSTRYRERAWIGKSSQAIGAETTTYSMKDMPSDVRTLLYSYQKVIQA